MSHALAAIAFTPSVKAAQQRDGSRASYARNLESGGEPFNNRLARIFHERSTGWVGGADPLAFLGHRPINDAIDAAQIGDATRLGVATPSPTWDAGRFGVNARARHWMEFYGLSARAAVMKTCFIGCADASNTRTRRVLRTMAAPTFSSLVRIVAVQACASSVPFRARRRRLIISV